MRPRSLFPNRSCSPCAVVAPGFEEVGAVFDVCVPEDEPGGAFCATWAAEVVVDVVGGLRDRGGQRWQVDTTCLIASGTKGVVATAMLMLIERGRLALDTPVATYWPQFAAAGKGRITVADVVGHTAGLPGIVTPIAIEQVGDPELIETALATQAPIVEVGQPTYQL